MQPAPAIFTPTPDQALRLLLDLDDCSLSFHDLAAKYRTNSNSLALWLSSEPIKSLVQSATDAMAFRVRRAATSRLPAALDAVVRIITDDRQRPAEPPLDPAAPDYRARRELNRRRDESIRRAATLVLRLCNFFSPLKPPTPRPPAHPDPAPANRPSAASPRPARRADLPGPGAPHPAQPAAPARNGAAPRPSPAANSPIPAPFAPTSTSPSSAITFGPTPAPSGRLPILSTTDRLAQSHPQIPRHILGPRGPGLLLAHAGACTSAAP